MKGEAGDMGLPGDNGTDGEPGNDGSDGNPGPPGFNGTDGLPGPLSLYKNNTYMVNINHKLLQLALYKNSLAIQKGTSINSKSKQLVT